MADDLVGILKLVYIHCIKQGRYFKYNSSLTFFKI